MTYIFFFFKGPVQSRENTIFLPVIEMNPCMTDLNICEREIKEEVEDRGQLPAQSAEIAPSMAALEDK